MTANQYLLGIDIGGTWLRFILAKSEDGSIPNIVPGKNTKVFYDSPLDETKNILNTPPFSTIPNNEKIAAYIISKLDEYLTHLDIRKEKIGGIGISAAGKILKDKRFMGSNVPLKYATRAGKSYGVEIIPALRRIFPSTVISIENDANCSGIVQSIYYKHMGIDPDKTFYITVSTGIGGGGPKRDMDEVGHINVDGYFPELVPKCGCGSFGCIEAYASGEGIKNQALGILNLYCHSPEKFKKFNVFEEIRTQGKYDLKHITDQTVLKDMFLKNEAITAKSIFEFANLDNSGNYTDEFSAYLVETAAERFAKVLLTISNIHDIERFGIGGTVVMNNPLYLDIVKDKLSRIYNVSDDIFKSGLEIEISPLGEYIGDYGALFLVINQENEKNWIETIMNLEK